MKCIQSLLAVFLLVISATSAATTIEMTVNGLVCAFCAQGIEKKLRQLPATEDVVVNLAHRFVAVVLKDGQDVPDEMLRKAMTDAGYSVTAIERTATPMAEVRERLKRAQP
jgi:copper chaperone CopZ